MPKISVIIPTYNRADLLPRAINSVLNQTFKDFELIIVDDGSTDNTKEIVSEYLKKDNRIKYIYQENSGGPAKPKNVGIKNSKGKYIAILDSDDEWFPKKLKIQLDCYEKNLNNNIGLIGCGGIKISKNEKKYIQPNYFLPIKSKELLERCIPFSSSSILIKRSVFNTIGLFDENFKSADDRDLYIRINQLYNFIFVQKPLFYYFIHDNNISSKDNKDLRINEQEKIIEKHKKIYKKHSKIYYKKIKILGTKYLLNNQAKIARKKFIYSMAIKPFSRIYINYVLSFSPKLYKYILSIKKNEK